MSGVDETDEQRLERIIQRVKANGGEFDFNEDWHFVRDHARRSVRAKVSVKMTTDFARSFYKDAAWPAGMEVRTAMTEMTRIGRALTAALSQSEDRT